MILDILFYFFVTAVPLSLLASAAMQIVKFVYSNKKRARIEGKMIPDSKRLIWRIVNTGVRNLSVVEIGLHCADKYVSYRPLYAATDDINNIPHLLVRGEVASYRKEMERFMFKQSEADALKISNPYVYFYCKDAEGKIYSQRSEYKFVQYFTMLNGGGN